MRITVKDGEELTRYESSGQIGEGHGVKAGITYRLPDGRMVHVPEWPPPFQQDSDVIPTRPPT